MRALIVQPEDVSGPRSSLGADVKIGQRNIRLEIVEVDDIRFDRTSEQASELVLVRITGFSLNFRDRSWIEAKSLEPRAAATERAVGSEFVGEVLDFGKRVTRFQRGDRVMADMSWPSNGIAGTVGGVPTNQASIELQVFHHGKLEKVPEGMSPEVASAFCLGAQTACCMVRRLNLQPGKRVLVTAATSNTGLFVIAALLANGVRVVAATKSWEAAKRLTDLGVERVFNANQQEANHNGAADDELAQFAASIGGFDAVVDPFCDVYLMKSLSVLGMFGKYVTCGMLDQSLDDIRASGSTTEIEIPRMISLMIVKNLVLVGNCLGLKCDLEQAIADWVGGKWKVAIDSVHRGSQITGFLERTYVSKDRFGKVVYLYEPTMHE